MDVIPIFPLPNCVLFPGAILPLHIFEERYRNMIQAIVSGKEPKRNLAIALLRDGYEPLYHTDHAPIHNTVCIGRMVQCEPLPDGRYNLMLLGTARARVATEQPACPYRRAELTPVDTVYDVNEPEAAELIETLQSLVREADVQPCSDPAAFEQLVTQTEGIAGVVDMLSHFAIDIRHSSLKQRILEEPAVSVRSEILLRYLRDQIESQHRAESQDHIWPPPVNPN